MNASRPSSWTSPLLQSLLTGIMVLLLGQAVLRFMADEQDPGLGLKGWLELLVMLDARSWCLLALGLAGAWTFWDSPRRLASLQGVAPSSAWVDLATATLPLLLGLLAIGLLFAAPALMITMLLGWLVWRASLWQRRLRVRAALMPVTVQVRKTTTDMQPWRRAEGSFARLFLWPVLGCLQLVAGGARALMALDKLRRRMWPACWLLLPRVAMVGLRGIAALSVICAGAARPLARAAMRAAAAGLVAALLLLPVALWRTEAAQYSQTSPTVAALLLQKTPAAQRTAQAQAALERALQTGNVGAIEAVLRSGSQGGIFLIQAPKTADCVSWPMGRFARHLLAPALAATGVRMALTETPDAAALLRAARCVQTEGTLAMQLGIEAAHSNLPPIDIFAAVDSAQPELLSGVLQAGATLDVRDWQQRTPLLAALDRLVAARAGQLAPSIQAVDPGEQPVSKLRQMVSTLLARHPDLGARDRAGRSVVYLALEAGLPLETDAPMLQATPPGTRTAAGATLVHAAAASCEPALLDAMLRRGEDARALTHDGRSALHMACGGEVALRLLKLGLSADAPDQRGQTPLHLAVQRGDLAAASVLGRYSSAQEQRDLFGKTAMDYAPASRGTGPGPWLALGGELDRPRGQGLP